MVNNMKKIPIRTCAVSKEKLDKRELFRVVRNKEGEVFVDDTLKANGRGVYLKKDANIINKAKDKKVLDYHLGVKVSDEIYDELMSKL